MQMGTVLLKKEPYTRQKGLDAYVEYTVVGENNRAWLVTRYPTRGLEKAIKLPKQGDVHDHGYFKNWDEVRAYLNFDGSVSRIEKLIGKITDMTKLRRIEAILSEGSGSTEMTVKKTVKQPPKLTAQQFKISPRKRAAAQRKRDGEGKFIKMKDSHNSGKSLH